MNSLKAVYLKILSFFRNRHEDISELIIQTDAVPDSTETKAVEINDSYVVPISYPIFLKPFNNRESRIEDIIRRDKGLLEDYFFDYLMELVPYKIENNVKILYGNNYYIPDYIIINEECGVKTIIEIDEPYSIDNDGSLVPVHHIGSDDYRNKLFLDYGYNIIRLAEEQVAKNPELCCLYIKAVIEGQFLELPMINCWTFEESIEMIGNNYRNQYLPLEFKGLKKASNYQYRSFQINHIHIQKKKDNTDWVVVHFSLSESSLNTIRECWIPITDFLNAYYITAYYKKMKERDYLLPLRLGWEQHFNHFLVNNKQNQKCRLEGYGDSNNKFFNLRGGFKLQIPDASFCFWDDFYTELKNKRKMTMEEIDEFFERKKNANQIRNLLS